MNPTLSIIIPFFGKADKQLLEQCLNSIRTQPVHQETYEILVVDDRGGKGVYTARNNGIRQAQGTYILFVDADDSLFPNTLGTCITLLKEKAPDMLSFDYRRVKEGTTENPLSPTYQETVYSSGAEFMSRHNYFGTVWRYFISRELILNENLFFSERTHHQDEIFCAEAYFTAHSLIHISLEVYAYHIRSNSLVRHRGEARREERIADFKNILTSLQHFLQMHPQATELQQAALKRRISFLTIDFLLQLLRNRCSYTAFKKQLQALTTEKLLPLPNQKYNSRYTLARLAINTLLYPLYQHRP